MSTKSLHNILIGPPKDPMRPGVIKHLHLVAFLAWVGLGADGLSSACYGPEEAYLELGEHRFLALPLALMIIGTVTIIGLGYSQVIARFPGGGGGYMVATKLLGKKWGLVSGCALVVDYVLTVTISISSGVDQLFSFLPEGLAGAKIWFAAAMLVFLIFLNLRGVKESIVFLLPIFFLFLVTHAVLLGAVFLHQWDRFGFVLGDLKDAVRGTPRFSDIGLVGLGIVLMHAFSRGAGTFTGLEAVSNSMEILHEPRVKTGKRTMLYMASSLAVCASAILIGYVMFDVSPKEHRTLNAVLFENITASWPGGPLIVIVALIAEAALLFVAAQAGFIGGPRALAVMAYDGWVPKRFAHLSNRLVVADGVILVGIAAAIFLIATRGSVKLLVVLYSINVFVTFVMSLAGMCRHWLDERKNRRPWKRSFVVAAAGLAISLLTLVTMLITKFTHGGWATVLVTSAMIALCVAIRRHYRRVEKKLVSLSRALIDDPPEVTLPTVARDPSAPCAIILVSGFNGLGMHALLTLHRLYPGHYKNFVFVSVGQIDFDRFQAEEEIAELARENKRQLMRYEPHVRAIGGYFEVRSSVGADVVGELEEISVNVASEYARPVFFGGQLTFSDDNVFAPLLHGYVTYEMQRRLHAHGMQMMILPTRFSG